jgi:acetyltransferase-like isoleucine patch superfamily enzyme
VVALNSIVTKKMPKNCLIAGSPAKVIKEDIIWSERAIGKDSLNQMIDELEL